MKKEKKIAYFQVIKWGSKVKLKISTKLSNWKTVDYKGKFQKNLLGKIVNKQSTTNLQNMCKYVLLFYQKKAIKNKSYLNLHLQFSCKLRGV